MVIAIGAYYTLPSLGCTVSTPIGFALDISLYDSHISMVCVCVCVRTYDCAVLRTTRFVKRVTGTYQLLVRVSLVCTAHSTHCNCRCSMCRHQQKAENTWHPSLHSYIIYIFISIDKTCVYVHGTYTPINREATAKDSTRQQQTNSVGRLSIVNYM